MPKSKNTKVQKKPQRARKPKAVTLKVTGKGDYKVSPSNTNKFFRAVGETAGKALEYLPVVGKYIPAPLLSAASSALGDAGSWLSRALGFGKYTVKKNSLLQPSRVVEKQPYVASPPSFGTSKTGSDIIFSHREYIGDVRSSVVFKSTTYPINPGNPQMFPWMSRIASLYEEYEMLGLMFEYRATSATAVGTTSSGMGVVLMATDYDCYDTTFDTKRQMEAAEFSSAAVPFETFLHPVECDRSRNVLSREFVVPGITSYTQASGDARMSVMGNFTIATEGQQFDNNVIGELWVTYHVRLSRPILEITQSPALTYTYTASGTIGTNGQVTIVSDRVTPGMPKFQVVPNGLTGVDSRLNIFNTPSSFRDQAFVVSLTSGYFVDPTAGAVTPFDYGPTVVSGSPFFSDIGFGNAQGARPAGAIYSRYSYMYRTVVTFRSPSDAISIPVANSTTAIGALNLTITPINVNITADAISMTNRERRTLNRPAASSSTFDPTRDVDSSTGNAAPAIACSDEESEDFSQPGSSAAAGTPITCYAVQLPRSVTDSEARNLLAKQLEKKTPK